MNTATIEITHWDGRKELITLRPGAYTIGRKQADVLLPGDRTVSRLHAKLEILHRFVRIVDLGSTCGTFEPSGERVEEAYALRVGDWVTVGSTQLCVKSVALLAAASGESTAMTQPELQLDLGDAANSVARVDE